MWITRDKKIYCVWENRTCNNAYLCCNFCKNTKCQDRCCVNSATCKYLTDSTYEFINHATKNKIDKAPEELKENTQRKRRNRKKICEKSTNNEIEYTKPKVKSDIINRTRKKRKLI